MKYSVFSFPMSVIYFTGSVKLLCLYNVFSVKCEHCDVRNTRKKDNIYFIGWIRKRFLELNDFIRRMLPIRLHTTGRAWGCTGIVAVSANPKMMIRNEIINVNVTLFWKTSPRDHCQIKPYCLVDLPSARIAPNPMLAAYPFTHHYLSMAVYHEAVK